MSDKQIELKGSLFPLSVLSCKELSIDSLKHQLNQKLAQAPAFFIHAPIILNVANFNQAPDFASIKALFSELKLVLVGVCGANADIKKVAHEAGLATLQLGKDAAPVAVKKALAKSEKFAAKEVLALQDVPDLGNAPFDIAVESDTAIHTKVVEQTVRSGQQIYAKGCDLIVKGTVGAGAEVIADGNVHIYGTLRGKAVAGASGDKSKRIYCYNLQAELVSIAGNYWVSESLQGKFWEKGACIKLQDDQLVLAELV